MAFTRTPLLYLWVVVLCRGQVVATTEHDESIVYADIGAQMPWVFFRNLQVPFTAILLSAVPSPAMCEQIWPR